MYVNKASYSWHFFSYINLITIKFTVKLIAHCCSIVESETLVFIFQCQKACSFLSKKG